MRLSAGTLGFRGRVTVPFVPNCPANRPALLGGCLSA